MRTLHLLDDHPGMGETTLSKFLRSSCCNAPVLLWHWFAGDLNMSHCTDCRELIGAPDGFDMDRIKRGELPILDETLEFIEVVSLPREDPQSLFRTIRVQ